MAVTADFEAYLADDWYGHPMTVTALRFDPAEIDNDPNIAISAIEKALSTPKQVPGYRWQVFHIAVSDRYITRHARNYLGGSKREATGE